MEAVAALEALLAVGAALPGVRGLTLHDGASLIAHVGIRGSSKSVRFTVGSRWLVVDADDALTESSLRALERLAEVAEFQLHQSAPVSEPTPILSELVRNFPFGALAVFDEERYLAAGGEVFGDTSISPSEIIGVRPQEAMPEELYEVGRSHREAALRGEHSQVEVGFEGRWFAVSYGPLTDEAGQVLAAVSMSRDITEERTLASELVRAKTLLAEAEAIAHVGSWSYEIATGQQEWSEELYRIYGRDRGAGPMPRESLMAMVHPEHRSRVEQVFADSVSRLDISFPILRCGNQERWVRIVGQPVSDEAGLPIRFVGTTQDVTSARDSEQARLAHEAELEAARDAAEAGARTKSEFLATMSHEMRTPLHGVIASASLLADTQLDASQSELLSTVQTSSEALLAVIDGVLDFSKLDRGAVDLEKEPFDISRCIEDALVIVADRAAAKRLGLRYRIDSRLERVWMGDVGRLRQMLLNLVGNAVKFTEQGAIRVEVEPDAEGRIVFSVHDTGIGIPESLQSHLFRPFTQLDASTRRRFGGTGLGLAIVRNLAEHMGGEAFVESVEGEGSTFGFSVELEPSGEEPERPLENSRLRLRLGEEDRRWLEGHLRALGAHWDGPAATAEVVVARAAGAGGPRYVLQGPAKEVALSLHPLRRQALVEAFFAACGGLAPSQDAAPNGPASVLSILVAEDNPVNQRVMRRTLERLGHRADIVDNGRLACAAVRSERYDLVLMDMQMPEMDGLEATRRIRAEAAEAGRPHVTIWALTANALSTDRTLCLEAGMDDFLTKPLRLHQLKERLQSLSWD